MEKLFFVISVVFGLAVCASAQISYSNTILYQSLNLQTNIGSSVIIGSAIISGKSIQEQVQHSGLASTTNMPTYFQISLDNANWSTIQTNNPTSTNSGAIDAWPVSASTFTVYGRSVQINTNSATQSAGATIVLIPFGQ